MTWRRCEEPSVHPSKARRTEPRTGFKNLGTLKSAPSTAGGFLLAESRNQQTQHHQQPSVGGYLATEDVSRSCDLRLQQEPPIKSPFLRFIPVEVFVMPGRRFPVV